MNQEAINWERLDNPKGEAVLGVCRQSLKRDFGQTRFQLYTDSSWMHVTLQLLRRMSRGQFLPMHSIIMLSMLTQMHACNMKV
jgi:hypothetical protein